MKAGVHCRLSKVEEARPGELPIQAWSRGALLSDVVPGQPITLLRYARSARHEEGAGEVSRLGLFTSSPVIRVEAKTGMIQTVNSTWHITMLPPLDAVESALLASRMEYHPDPGAPPQFETSPEEESAVLAQLERALAELGGPEGVPSHVLAPDETPPVPVP